jgi:serine phosphatase RsbU (regulator of sigma subunit)/anti-sigma regulatory factor (Ser/Thr protein kinase)
MNGVTMTTRLRSFWQALIRRGGEAEPAAPPVARPPQHASGPAIEIAPNDPIVAYFQAASGVVEVDRLSLDSPALQAMKAAGVKLCVPLVSQGELVGVLSLGPRLSEQGYSADDHALLNNLATQATPALRVAQLARQQQVEVQARERMEQEMRVARLIQKTLLPNEIPALPGWKLGVHYQPARAVGGDFYDFFVQPDGRLVLIVGDVTDKGVPAALVMATTRSILRGCARRLLSPSAALVRANELLHPEIPAPMFVTCLYAILDPASGRLEFANAGHDLPYRRLVTGVEELRATGMPLGLMSGMQYDEREITLAPGESILFYSDGLVEAHNARREMFSFPRLRGLINEHCAGAQGCAALIEMLLADLADFTGPDWEQEDDITLLMLEREALPLSSTPPAADTDETAPGDGQWRILAEFSLPSELGNECEATTQVVAAIQPLNLPDLRVQRLKTAVAEAIMNAIEHGNKKRPELPVFIQVLASPRALAVRISDHGGGGPIAHAEPPDLYAKLAGQQSPRGWGLFLIEKMVDEVHISSDEAHHTLELILYLEGDSHASQKV